MDSQINVEGKLPAFRGDQTTIAHSGHKMRSALTTSGWIWKWLSLSRKLWTDLQLLYILDDFSTRCARATRPSWPTCTASSRRSKVWRWRDSGFTVRLRNRYKAFLSDIFASVSCSLSLICVCCPYSLLIVNIFILISIISLLALCWLSSQYDVSLLPTEVDCWD